MPQKPHKVTPENQKIIIDYLSAGRTQEAVCKKLDICLYTLHKHYKKEIETALDSKVVDVSKSLYEKAVKGDTVAMIFLLKTQGRWRTEDSKQATDSNDEVAREIKELRAKLDAEYKREY